MITELTELYGYHPRAEFVGEFLRGETVVKHYTLFRSYSGAVELVVLGVEIGVLPDGSIEVDYDSATIYRPDGELACGFTENEVRRLVDAAVAEWQAELS